MQQQIGERPHPLEPQRRYRAVAGEQHGDVTRRAADPREGQRADLSGGVERLRRWRSQEPYEGVRRVELVLTDLRIGDRIDARRQRLATDRLLGWILRIGDPHLHHEGVAIELAQRRHLRLAAEPPDATVRRPVGAARNSVAVAVERVRVRQDFALRHGVEQPEPEHIWCRSVA